MKFALSLPGKLMRLGGKLIAIMLKTSLPGIGHLLVKGFVYLKDLLIKGAKNLLSSIWTKLGEVVGKIKIPGFGTLAKGIGSLGKGAKAVAMGSKAVPVIGAAATFSLLYTSDAADE